MVLGGPGHRAVRGGVQAHEQLPLRGEPCHHGRCPHLGHGSGLRRATPCRLVQVTSLSRRGGGSPGRFLGSSGCGGGLLPGFRPPELAAVIGLRFRAGKRGSAPNVATGLLPVSRRLQDAPTLHLGCAPNPQLSQARSQSSLVQDPGSGSSDLRPLPLQRQSPPIMQV